MNIYPKDKEYLNLQQQVAKNRDDIARHYEVDRTLADYGIRIIGFYETIEDAKEQLGDPYNGPYGNAVGIGAQAPYIFYIWTRANNISDVDYWQDVGELAVVGPQGPQGEQGIQGIPGVNPNFLTGKGQPTISARLEDIYLDATTGDVYKITDGQWVRYGNIRGPQGLQGQTGPRGQIGQTGPQGPKGNDGDPGGFIKIGGFMVSESDLPNPTEINDTQIAFLVGSSEPYDLYIQVGATPATAVWYNIGTLNIATYVTVGGEFQGIWDADTKLDKVNINDGEYHAYIISDDGSQDTMYITSAADPSALVMRGGDGELFVPNYPTFPNEATSKDYVDNLITDSETITTSWEGPDLKLNLNADLVSDISRSVKTPISAVSAVSLPCISPAGVVSWQTTKNLISPYITYYTTVTSATTFQMTRYKGAYPSKSEIFPTNGTGLMNVVIVPKSGSSVSVSNIYKIEVFAYNANINTVIAYSSSTGVARVIANVSTIKIPTSHVIIDYSGGTTNN